MALVSIPRLDKTNANLVRLIVLAVPGGLTTASRVLPPISWLQLVVLASALRDITGTRGTKSVNNVTRDVGHV